jgi:SAM-dependent methyltransferase
MKKIDLYENYTTTSVLSDRNEAEFTKWSAKYLKKYVIPHFPKNKNSNILEIGCGYGRYTKAMGEFGYANVLGIDISEEQINYARKNLGISNVQKEDAIDFLEKNSKKYDTVVLMDVMEHLELDYSLRLLQRIYQSLNNNGVLIIQVPNGMSFLAPSFHSDVTHLRAYSAPSMTQSLRIGGFSNFEHYPLPPLVRGISSGIRSICWKCFINPVIAAYMLIANGGKMGGIYTSNLLTVAKK